MVNPETVRKLINSLILRKKIPKKLNLLIFQIFGHKFVHIKSNVESPATNKIIPATAKYNVESPETCEIIPKTVMYNVEDLANSLLLTNNFVTPF